METTADGPAWKPFSSAPKDKRIIVRHDQYGLLEGQHVLLSNGALISYNGEKLIGLACYDKRQLEWSDITPPA